MIPLWCILSFLCLEFFQLILYYCRSPEANSFLQVTMIDVFSGERFPPAQSLRGYTSILTASVRRQRYDDRNMLQEQQNVAVRRKKRGRDPTCCAPLVT